MCHRKDEAASLDMNLLVRGHLGGHPLRRLPLRGPRGLRFAGYLSPGAKGVQGVEGAGAFLDGDNKTLHSKYSMFLGLRVAGKRQESERLESKTPAIGPSSPKVPGLVVDKILPKCYNSVSNAGYLHNGARTTRRERPPGQNRTKQRRPRAPNDGHRLPGRPGAADERTARRNDPEAGTNPPQMLQGTKETNATRATWPRTSGVETRPANGCEHQSRPRASRSPRRPSADLRNTRRLRWHASW